MPCTQASISARMLNSLLSLMPLSQERGLSESRLFNIHNIKILFHVGSLSMVADIASDNVLYERGSGHVASGECIKEMSDFTDYYFVAADVSIEHLQKHSHCSKL